MAQCYTYATTLITTKRLIICYCLRFKSTFYIMNSNISGTDPHILAIGFLIAAFLCILGGFINLRFKNIAWRVTKWNNEVAGVPSKRTKSWEQMTAAGGWICIILGAIFLIIALSLFGKASSKSPVTDITGITMTSPAVHSHAADAARK